MTHPRLVVFSALDGTLRDHHSYDHAPAQPALDALRARRIPLVLVTSKTRAELLVLRERLGHRGPFIVENGGAIVIPEGALDDRDEGEPVDGGRFLVRGTPYRRVREVLERLRAQLAVDLEGFGDVSDAEVAAWTGLPLEDAARARARETSEPFRFHGDDAALARLREGLAAEGLTLTRGGRFHSAQGEVDKGAAVRYLLQRYRHAHASGTVTSVALGDSDNDLPMLRAVDIPIAIPPASGRAPLALDHPRRVVAAQAGPAGFREGIEAVLAQWEAGALD